MVVPSLLNTPVNKKVCPPALAVSFTAWLFTLPDTLALQLLHGIEFGIGVIPEFGAGSEMA
jgi:hypothetical protein